MAILRRKRLADGSFGLPEKVFGGLTDAEKVEQLEDDNVALRDQLAAMSSIVDILLGGDSDGE